MSILEMDTKHALEWVCIEVNTYKEKINSQEVPKNPRRIQQIMIKMEPRYPHLYWQMVSKIAQIP